MERGLPVVVQDATRRLGAVTALDGVTLEIAAGEFLCILGQSGSGKTTLLRAIAGLETLDRGSVRIGGRDMADVPPQARPVNTVFQSYALFPHLTVRGNVGFSLRMRGVDRVDADRRIARALDRLGIAALADRRPAQLSGGESQRTALARALINEPPVLLLDEPLSALDPKARIVAREELREIAAQLGTTVLMVTHDQTDAFALSSRMALMRAGRVVQVGTPEQVYLEPTSVEAAQAFGVTNVLPGRLVLDGDKPVVDCPDLTPSLQMAPPGFRADAAVAVVIRPDAVRVAAARIPGAQGVDATVVSCRFGGETVEYSLRLASGATLLARHPARGARPTIGVEGAAVDAWWLPEDVRILAL